MASRPVAPDEVVFEAIVEAVEYESGFDAERIMGRSQYRSLSHWRHRAWWLAYNLTGASYAQVGQHFDRDKATVISALRKIDRLLGDDGPGERKAIEALRLATRVVVHQKGYR